ncbi:Sugar transferase involved in LPS biosynthesis (colanic, teichoic acid) [Nonlabens sp. Hel1_33_55]|uniref:sugar transferase n=1 Tax=Nonlabens sp. Hel1_33_55 TaxID=1336802 RepID=UPI000875AEBF|nr:sugar transferase [Nonlabens sp. Hel1_33_55]SCX94606.1 Sugar transferase involved in LPS biosynthesis (colanic, teichoic acid) [Nonlabens sp. Hel1_33_55]
MPRLLDLILALIAALAFFPFLIVIWIICILDTQSIGIFVQTRIGQYGKKFKIIKFRSMVAGSATTFGSWIRKYKFDELPQLINIIKGDMAIVGPRPDIPGYYDKLVDTDLILLNLKPGLTSPAAIEFKNEEKILAQQSDPKKFNDEILFPEKVKLNLLYQSRKSIIYDLKVITNTIFGSIWSL